uniref:Uncharacterized protein n=1 Tax=Arundo donax TaxID=35708 RepID=A0A0A9EK53_ARUDO
MELDDTMVLIIPFSVSHMPVSFDFIILLMCIYYIYH